MHAAGFMGLARGPAACMNHWWIHRDSRCGDTQQLIGWNQEWRLCDVGLLPEIYVSQLQWVKVSLLKPTNAMKSPSSAMKVYHSSSTVSATLRYKEANWNAIHLQVTCLDRIHAHSHTPKTCKWMQHNFEQHFIVMNAILLISTETY